MLPFKFDIINVQTTQRAINCLILVVLLVFLSTQASNSYHSSDVRSIWKMRLIFFNCLIVLSQIIFNSIHVWRILVLEAIVLILWVLFGFVYCFVDPNDHILKVKGALKLAQMTFVKLVLVVTGLHIQLKLKPIKNFRSDWGYKS